MQTAALPETAPPQTQQTSRFTQTSVMEMWKDTTVTTNADGEEEASSGAKPSIQNVAELVACSPPSCAPAPLPWVNLPMATAS